MTTLHHPIIPFLHRKDRFHILAEGGNIEILPIYLFFNITNSYLSPSKIPIANMTRISFVLLLYFTCTISLAAQSGSGWTGHGGGEGLSTEQTCVTPDQRRKMAEVIQSRRAKHPLPETKMIVAFNWPLRPAAGFQWNSYYGINNYTDMDTGPGVLDYNCGSRTNNGHWGTDIDTWPFPWYMVQNNLVEVVAAAAGTIIGKWESFDDDHCSCVGDPNGMIIEHADGSVAWYSHFKKNSATSKSVGETVAQGEFLGIVASSGCSTQPHLHFEVWEDYPIFDFETLIDPFQGPCNDLNPSSWWTDQKPYRDPNLNALFTHSAVPEIGCPGPFEVPHFSNQFEPGATLYLAAYYRDQLTGHLSSLRIRRPDGTIWQSWTHTSPGSYNTSWWWWSWILPEDAPTGAWQFEIDYQGQTHIHEFTVGQILVQECPTDTLLTTVPQNMDTVSAANNLTTAGTITITSGNEVTFRAGNSILLTTGFGVQAGATFHAYIEDCSTETNVSFPVTSNKGAISALSPADISVFPNPFFQQLRLEYRIPEDSPVSLRLFSMNGSLVRQFFADQPHSAGFYEQELEVAQLQAGVYVLQLRHGNEVLTARVVKME
jgi:murein DD-endopeptidase MepM/ murein hydrolase activator NlpD